VIDSHDDATSIVTSLLIAEAGTVTPVERWLVLGGDGVLVAQLAGMGGEVHWRTVDARELARAPAGVVVTAVTSSGTYDCVLLPVPADRDLARRWLLQARDALEPGGVLILAGANAEGAKSVVADAVRVFGAPVAEHYRQKHRIARFRKTGEARDLPPWASADGIVPGTWQRFDVDLGEDVVTLETQPGVFAGNRLDAGTRLLLQHLEVEQGARVLDVGCGAGVIGIAASRQGAGHVDLVDANLLAVEATARNLEQLGVPGRALASDVFSGVPDERYDLIVSNPPFHRGKQVDYSVANRLISEAPEHLARGGHLLVVANAFLAYGKQMERVFQQVETVAATRQYHVLAGTKPR
jgi:16S rRNA (guanine1207-N2)-methyltransferase